MAAGWWPDYGCTCTTAQNYAVVSTTTAATQTCVCSTQYLYSASTSNPRYPEFDFVAIERRERMLESRRIQSRLAPLMRKAQRYIGRQELAALPRSNC